MTTTGTVDLGLIPCGDNKEGDMVEVCEHYEKQQIGKFCCSISELVIGRCVLTTTSPQYFVHCREDYLNNIKQQNNSSDAKNKVRKPGPQQKRNAPCSNKHQYNQSSLLDVAQTDERDYVLMFLNVFDTSYDRFANNRPKDWKQIRHSLLQIAEKAQRVGSCTALVLEAYVVHNLYKRVTVPIGVMFLNNTVTKEEGLNKLRKGIVKSGDCKIEWVNEKDFVFAEESNQKVDSRNCVDFDMKSETDCIVMVQKAINRRVFNKKKEETLPEHVETQFSLNPTQFILSTWLFGGEMKRKAGLSDQMGILRNEFMKLGLYMYFNHWLRHHRLNYMNRSIFLQAMRHICFVWNEYLQIQQSPQSSQNYNHSACNLIEMNELDLIFDDMQDGIDDFVSGFSTTNTINVDIDQMQRQPLKFAFIMADFCVRHRVFLDNANRHLLSLIQRKNEVVSLHYSKTILPLKSKLKQELNEVEVKMVRVLEEVNEHTSTTIPLDIFNIDANRAWCKDTCELLTKRLSKEALTKEIFQDIQFKVRKRKFPCVYGSERDTRLACKNRLQVFMFHDSVEDIESSLLYNAHEGESLNKFVIRSGNLTELHLSIDQQQNEVSSSLSSEDYKNSEGVDFVKSAAAGIYRTSTTHKQPKSQNAKTRNSYAMSTMNRTPIWKTVTLKNEAQVHTFNIMSKLEDDDGDSDDAHDDNNFTGLGHNKMEYKVSEPKSFEECIHQAYHPKAQVMKLPGSTSELTNPLLDVKNVVFDIDLTSSSKIDLTECVLSHEFMTNVYNDIVDMSEEILSRIGFVEGENCTHYVFKSDKDQMETDSIGLRYIISLPDSVLLSTLCVSQCVEIFKTLRYFKDHLSLFGGSGVEDKIYDEMIYGTDGRASHGIRGPYQTKITNSSEGKLNLVWCATRYADGSLCCENSSCGECQKNFSDSGIPYRHRFVHGFLRNERNASTRCIEEITGISPIDDEHYLKAVEETHIHDFTKKWSKTAASSFMEEIEMKIIAMHPSEPVYSRISRIEEAINEGWDRNWSLQMAAVLENENYDWTVVDGLRNGVYTFKLMQSSDGKDMAIYLSNVNKPGIKYVDFCLHTAHENNTNAYITVGAHRTSNHLDLKCSCFKPSCQSKTTGFNHSITFEDGVFLFSLFRRTFFERVCVPLTQLYFRDVLDMYILELPNENKSDGSKITRKIMTKKQRQEKNAVYTVPIVRSLGSGIGDKIMELDKFIGAQKRQKANCGASTDDRELIDPTINDICCLHEYLGKNELEKVSCILSMYCSQVYDPVANMNVSVFRINTQIYILYLEPNDNLDWYQIPSRVQNHSQDEQSQYLAQRHVESRMDMDTDDSEREDGEFDFAAIISSYIESKPEVQANLANGRRQVYASRNPVHLYRLLGGTDVTDHRLLKLDNVTSVEPLLLSKLKTLFVNEGKEI